MYKWLLGFILMFAGDTGQAYLVYPKQCIKAIEIVDSTQVRVEWVNGQPDYKNAVLLNVQVRYARDCGYAHTVISK